MEKKNTILLTVIAVATLLVAVVGATFAYFTATATNDGDGSSTGAVNTATVASVKLTTADAGKSQRTVYPGTMNYAAMSVVGSKDVTGTATVDTDYNMTYTVKGTITLGSEFTEGDVTYSVYRTTASVSAPLSCELQTTPAQGGTQYSDNCSIAEALTSAAGYTALIEDQAVNNTTGNLTTTVTVDNQTLSSDGLTTYYYYLVVTYSEESDNQNLDQSKTILASLDSVTVTNTAEVE